MPKIIKPGTKVERCFSLNRAAIDESTRTVELAFSSEEPYDRYWGREILDHSPQSIRLGRLTAGGPLLCDHDSRDHVGVIESVQIGADRVGRAVVRFGKGARADEVYRDVLDGIRRSISVGYMIHKATLVEKGEELDTYRVTDWEPFEVSLVSVPADPTVGIGRAADFLIEERIPTMQVTEAPDLDKVRAEARDAEKSRVSTLIAIGEQFKQAGLAAEAVRSGESVDAFRAKLMDKLASQPLPAPSAQLDLSGGEVKRYSVLRAIRAMVDRDWSQAGFERECHQAICQRAGVAEGANGGFYLPYEVQKRDMTAGTAANGGYLVATDNLASSFIDLLRKRAVVARLGATMLSGLVGNVTIPKLTAGGTAYWLTNEATAITESQQTLGQVSMSPKNVGAYTEFSRQLLLQANPGVDSLIANDLAKVVALAIDLAALNGSGISGQPTGLLNTAGIGSVTGTSLNYAGILEFQADIAAANVSDPQSLGFLTTPTVAALLMQRQAFASTDSPLWEGNMLNGTVAGVRAAASTQCPTATAICGDWAELLVGEWGFLEIATNPYANFAGGIIGLRAMQTVDVGVRQPGAFSVATSIT